MASWNGYDDYETGFEKWDYNKLSKAEKAIYDKKATEHSEKETLKILKKAKIPFLDTTFDDSEFDPMVYDGRMSVSDYKKASKACVKRSKRDAAKIVKDTKFNKKEVKTMASTVTKSKPVAKKKYSSKEKAAYYMGAGIALAKGNKANSILNEGDAKITRSARKGFLSVTKKANKKS